MTTEATGAATAAPQVPTWGERPRTPAGWIDRAREVATHVALDAVERDRANQTPHAEVALLKESGLVTLLGPPAHGGGGQDWTTALRVVRAVSAGDGSIGQLLGYHYLWAWAARLVGTPEQIEAVEQAATREQWFYGGAVNPRDSDLSISVEGDELVFRGQKSFSTGGRVSDVTVLEGVIEGSDKHVFAIVPTGQPAIEFLGDWDNLGQRLTESGGVRIHGVRVPWESAAGYVRGPDGWAFVPRTYNTLNVPLIQLIFANLYLGIAQGALTTAATYTRERTRAWPYTPDLKERGVDEFHVLETYVTGARATASSVGLDIFWRNIRTHSLHDPVAHKRAEVGRYALLGEIPEPTWYT